MKTTIFYQNRTNVYLKYSQSLDAAYRLCVYSANNESKIDQNELETILNDLTKEGGGLRALCPSVGEDIENITNHLSKYFALGNSVIPDRGSRIVDYNHDFSHFRESIQKKLLKILK